MGGHFKLRNGGRRRRILRITVTAECLDPGTPVVPIADEVVLLPPAQTMEIPFELNLCRPTVFHFYILVDGGAYTFAVPVEFVAPPEPGAVCRILYENPPWPAPPQQMRLTLTCPGMDPETVTAFSY